ncbi:DUF4421 domain-containing protein [Flavobacteriaceae bacterium TP-CH-4]|uniref:DUF4421 domain-containing protein n=1 Tax=Pelagihabitans pacificus TaxID=2696054 RepID=A0A967AUU0_9FLAO|nr:DUF4421 family protein [Pelagihabitans pacificus]NHF60352.1 DUF4421 domain-containing protein [Pelagihabitans pacificus]
MGIKTFVALSLLWYGTSIAAQDVDDYIRKFPGKITTRIGVQNTSNSFTVTDKETGEQSEFIPNDKTYLGLSVLFRSVEVDLGYAPSFFSENQDNQDSKLFTLNFRMFLGQWMQTLDFYNQKGFFEINEVGTTSFPEFTTLKLGGTTSYIFNKRFSFRAVGFQNEWQKKSAGSFIPSFTFYFTRFGLDALPQGNSYSYDIAIGPGYYYNWVVKNHLIVGAGTTLGFGANITRSDDETFSTGLAQVVLRTALGYNSEKFFTGLNFSAQVLEYEQEDNTVFDDAITFVELYIGYRFNAPKKWIKKADDFNRRLGLD